MVPFPIVAPRVPPAEMRSVERSEDLIAHRLVVVGPEPVELVVEGDVPRVAVSARNDLETAPVVVATQDAAGDAPVVTRVLVVLLVAGGGEMLRDRFGFTPDQIERLLASEDAQWKTIAWEIGKVRDRFGKETELGRRRTSFAEAQEIDLEAVQQAMIEKEPVTVVVSDKGWMRAMKGHQIDPSTLTFKEGDTLKTALPAHTTDKVLVFTTTGKFYTIGVDRLPGGRGHGEPIRLMVDMDNDADIVTAFVHRPGRKLLVASSAGNGFVVGESDVSANTRKGRQVMNVKMPDEARICRTIETAEGGAAPDHVAVVGENRKLLVFPLEQVPEMTRGKGVRLQRYKDGGIGDAKVFAMQEGLSWQDSSGRTFTKSRDELAEWMGVRAGAGRMVPKGFPRSGRFG